MALVSETEGARRYLQVICNKVTSVALNLVVRSKLNCEVLWDDLAYEVRWAVAGDSIVLQLVARLEGGEYMAFGVSGHDSKSQMVGGDVTVAWVDKDTLKGQARDYYLDAKSQCSGSRGSCPDDRIQEKGNSVRLLNAALVNGYSIVTYQRSLKPQDEYDRPIFTNGSQPIIWAVGPLNQRQEVSYHSIANRADILLDFGRPPKWNCPTPESQNVPNHGEMSIPVRQKPAITAPAVVTSVSSSQHQSSNRHEVLPAGTHRLKPNTATPAPAQKVKPWDIPAIQCNEPEDGVYYAQMGPTGGKHGYPAITGHVGWGISWYINGLLIPEVNVVRGRTYTFITEGGLDPQTPARYHPFYITDDPVGGYEYKTPEERAKVQIFAGAVQNKKGEVRPTGVGRLCNWTPDQSQPPADDFASFGAYQRTLRLICDPGEPGIVQWTVGADTPDTVYYQCYTHRYLGWKINVLDECEEGAASDVKPIYVSAPEKAEKTLDSEHEPDAQPSIQHVSKVKPDSHNTLQQTFGSAPDNLDSVSQQVTFIPVPQFHFFNEETGEPLDEETAQRMNPDLQKLKNQFLEALPSPSALAPDQIPPPQSHSVVNFNNEEQSVNVVHVNGGHAPFNHGRTQGGVSFNPGQNQGHVSFKHGEKSSPRIPFSHGPGQQSQLDITFNYAQKSKFNHGGQSEALINSNMNQQSLAQLSLNPGEQPQFDFHDEEQFLKFFHEPKPAYINQVSSPRPTYSVQESQDEAPPSQALPAQQFQLSPQQEYQVLPLSQFQPGPHNELSALPQHQFMLQNQNELPVLASQQFPVLSAQSEKPFLATTQARPFPFDGTTIVNEKFHQDFLKNYHQLQAEAAAKLKKHNHQKQFSSGKPTRLQYSAPRRPTTPHHAMTLQQRPLPPGMFRPPFLPPPNKKSHQNQVKRPISAGSQRVPTYASPNSIPNRPNAYNVPQKPLRYTQPPSQKPQPTSVTQMSFHHATQNNLQHVFALQKLLSTITPQNPAEHTTPSYKNNFNTQSTPLAVNTGFNPSSVQVEGGFKPILNTGIAPSFKAAEKRMDDLIDEDNVEDTVGVIDLTKLESRQEDVQEKSGIEDKINETASKTNTSESKEDIFKHLKPVMFEPMFVPSPPDYRIQKTPSKHKKKPTKSKYESSIKTRNSYLEPYNSHKNKYVKMRPRPTLIRRPLYPDNVVPPFKIPVRGGSPQFRYQQSDSNESKENTTDFEIIDMNSDGENATDNSADNILDVIEKQEGNSTEEGKIEVMIVNTDDGVVFDNEFQIKNATNDDEVAMAAERQDVFIAATGDKKHSNPTTGLKRVRRDHVEGHVGDDHDAYDREHGHHHHDHDHHDDGHDHHHNETMATTSSASTPVAAIAITAALLLAVLRLL